MEIKNDSTFKRCLEGLSSVKLFFRLSIILFILFYAASVMCKKGTDGGFMVLNNILLSDWLINAGPKHPVITSWFIIISICFFILALNICARVIIEFKQLSSVTSNNENASGLIRRKACILFIHASFILIFFFYFISSVTGIKSTGPVIEKGKILQHPSLPFQVECVDIIRPGKGKPGKNNMTQKPSVVLKVDNDEFKIPGWHKGIYYDINMPSPPPADPGTEIKPGKEAKPKPKLFVHSFNVKCFITVLVLWFLSFLIYTFVRPGVKKFFNR
ncbi:MAG: hypothetical protein PVG39_17480 [Desulfobacteraceae bacterium]|jgi:hypothetical protein